MQRARYRVNNDGGRWTWLESKRCWNGSRCSVWEFKSRRVVLNSNNFRGLRLFGRDRVLNAHPRCTKYVWHLLVLGFRCPFVSTNTFCTAVSSSLHDQLLVNPCVIQSFVTAVTWREWLVLYPGIPADLKMRALWCQVYGIQVASWNANRYVAYGFCRGIK